MEQEIVEIKCKKTGNVLVTGPLEYQNQFCVGVLKTYPNGAKGGVGYLVSDVDVVTLSQQGLGDPCSYMTPHFCVSVSLWQNKSPV